MKNPTIAFVVALLAVALAVLGGLYLNSKIDYVAQAVEENRYDLRAVEVRIDEVKAVSDSNAAAIEDIMKKLDDDDDDDD